MRSLLIIFCICSIAVHAQNNDAPAPLSTWNGKTFSIDTNKYRFAINFNDTTLFANTWRYMALGWQWNYAMPRIINKRLSVNVQPGSVDV